MKKSNGGQGRNRTADTRIFSPVTGAGYVLLSVVK